MRGVGTVVNVATVALGTVLGVTLGRAVPERLRVSSLQVVGLLTLVIGAKEALGTRNVVFPLVALIIGTVIGELLAIERRLESFGEWARRRARSLPLWRPRLPGRQARAVPGSGRDPDAGRFVEGFVTASLVFCVGPLTVVGSIRDGLGGPDHAQLLLVKSALDGLVAIVFATTLGWGVGLSVLTVAVFQGTLTAAAGAADALLTARMVTEMTAAGGVMILGIGLRLLDLKAVPVASFLPALVVAPLLVALFAR